MFIDHIDWIKLIDRIDLFDFWCCFCLRLASIHKRQCWFQLQFFDLQFRDTYKHTYKHLHILYLFVFVDLLTSNLLICSLTFSNAKCISFLALTSWICSRRISVLADGCCFFFFFGDIFQFIYLSIKCTILNLLFVFSKNKSIFCPLVAVCLFLYTCSYILFCVKVTIESWTNVNWSNNIPVHTFDTNAALI